MQEIFLNVIGPGGLVATILAIWLNGRVSREKIREVSEKVQPVSNGFARGVNEKLDAALAGIRELRQDLEADRALMSQHLRDHAIGALERKRNRDA